MFKVDKCAILLHDYLNNFYCRVDRVVVVVVVNKCNSEKKDIICKSSFSKKSSTGRGKIFLLFWAKIHYPGQCNEQRGNCYRKLGKIYKL